MKTNNIIPLSKARTQFHEWACRYADEDVYRLSPDGESVEITLGTECRNTGCCDAKGHPIFEHDYIKRWYYVENGATRIGNKTYARCVTCDIAEILYADNIIVKHIDGLPNEPLPYQYLHNPYEPLRLCESVVIGNSYSRHRTTFRKSEIELNKERKKRRK